ncbi:hypothetical protein M2271_006705 [Streptomyces sp. LBL]|uniref:CBM35 domain-containing protein n=1 Tax=Streptomyces sp. LBL TaxID=2940562 RepID=UPI002476B599|nr:carbohydrate-binding protein [Streptomyces sp. LBL]MDH6628870.1 hypothetical protein [Streptomyces sp. LBL]
MTAGNNGASTPEDDDPFGYLYEDGQANGAQPPSSVGYGYPNSVQRARAVGQRQYGQQAPAAATAPYGQVPQQGQAAPGQSNTHYAAPESFPGGAPTQQPSHGGGGGGGGRRGPNTKGLLIGAIAVVAAVVIGIGVAMMNGGDDDDDKAGGNEASTTPTTSQSSEPSPSASGSKASEAELPTTDAKLLRLAGGAVTASDVEGASAEGGVYVTGLNTVGSEITWSVNGIPKPGTYTLFAGYSVPGKDQEMTLTVNGKVFGNKMNLSNFARAGDGDYAKGWTQTYAWPTLAEGTNTISLSCQNGDKCDVLLDQLWLKAGQVEK